MAGMSIKWIAAVAVTAAALSAVLVSLLWSPPRAALGRPPVSHATRCLRHPGLTGLEKFMCRVPTLGSQGP